jgi:anti-anti-sigma factor
MQMIRETIGGVCVCRLDGELDKAASDYLRTRLFEVRQSGAKAVVLNLDKVAFISSVGLGALTAFRKAVTDAGGKVALCGLTTAIHKLITIARLDSLFVIVGHENAAIAAVRA